MLSKPDILKAFEEGLQFTPPVSSDAIDQVSIDLRLSRTFTTFKDPPAWMSGIYADKSVFEADHLWEDVQQDTFDLAPNGFVLAQTLEVVKMPNHLAGLVEGRSTWGRLGVSIHVTAPKIDPGFNARITLEMANFGKATVTLRAEIDKPAQLMLFRISTPLSEGDAYGANPDKDTFQHQQSPRG